MTTTTRRTLLAASAAAVTLPLVNLRAQTAPIDMKVSHYMPPGNTIDKWLTAWATELDKRSNGRIKLRVYPAGQLGPVPRQFDLARNGQAELAVGLAGATPGRYPMTELSNLPFVFPSTGPSSASTSRRLTELAPKFLASEFAGLKILWFGVTPPNTLFTGKREITSVADMKGLKMRFQGEQAAKVLRAVGAVPLQVPPGDVADGMAKGVIDGRHLQLRSRRELRRRSIDPLRRRTAVLVRDARSGDEQRPLRGPAARPEVAHRRDHRTRGGRPDGP